MKEKARGGRKKGEVSRKVEGNGGEGRLGKCRGIEGREEDKVVEGNGGKEGK